MQIIDDTPAEFPTVSICDSNPYTTLQAQFLINSLMQYLTNDKTGQKLKLSQLGFYNYYLLQNNTYIHPSYDINQLASAYTLDPNFSNSQRKALGWDLSQTMTSCTFNGIKCDFNNDFQWYFSPQYGNCYHFNAAPTGNQVKNHNLSVQKISSSSFP